MRYLAKGFLLDLKHKEPGTYDRETFEWDVEVPDDFEPPPDQSLAQALGQFLHDEKGLPRSRFVKVVGVEAYP